METRESLGFPSDRPGARGSEKKKKKMRARHAVGGGRTSSPVAAPVSPCDMDAERVTRGNARASRRTRDGSEARRASDMRVCDSAFGKRCC